MKQLIWFSLVCSWATLYCLPACCLAVRLPQRARVSLPCNFTGRKSSINSESSNARYRNCCASEIWRWAEEHGCKRTDRERSLREMAAFNNVFLLSRWLNSCLPIRPRQHRRQLQSSVALWKREIGQVFPRQPRRERPCVCQSRRRPSIYDRGGENRSLQAHQQQHAHRSWHYSGKYLAQVISVWSVRCARLTYAGGNEAFALQLESPQASLCWAVTRDC